MIDSAQSVRNSYDAICNKNISNKDISNELISLNSMLDYDEIIATEEILKDRTKREIIRFFELIKSIERKTYRSYKHIDLFLFGKLSKDMTFEENIRMLKDINYRFGYYCSCIEKNNKKTIKLIRKKIKTKEYMIWGGLNLFIRGILLKAHKDVDLISLKENSPNLTKFKLVTCNQVILVEVFSANDILLRDFNVTKNDIERKNKYNILCYKKMKSINLNMYGLRRKNILVCESEINQIRKNTCFSFTSYPLSIHTNQYLKELLYDRKLSLVEKKEFLNALDKAYFGEVVLMIYHYLKDIALSIRVHEILFTKIIINDSFRSKRDMNSRLLAMRFFLILNHKIIKKIAEDMDPGNDAIFEIGLRRMINTYIINFDALRNTL